MWECSKLMSNVKNLHDDPLRQRISPGDDYLIFRIPLISGLHGHEFIPITLHYTSRVLVMVSIAP